MAGQLNEHQRGLPTPRAHIFYTVLTSTSIELDIAYTPTPRLQAHTHTVPSRTTDKGDHSHNSGGQPSGADFVPAGLGDAGQPGEKAEVHHHADQRDDEGAHLQVCVEG